MKLSSYLIFLSVTSVFWNVIASQGPWCEKWQDEVVVCQDYRSFRGLLTILKHNVTFLPYDKSYHEGNPITWNAYDEHAEEEMKEILFMGLGEQTSTPCPNFTRRFDFKFCPGTDFNQTCPENSLFWSYETKLLLFVASGTEYGVTSLTIWNATNREWVETMFVGTLSTDFQLCLEVPQIHPYLKPPETVPSGTAEPYHQPEPSNPDHIPNVSPVVEPTQNAPQLNPQADPQMSSVEPIGVSCPPIEPPTEKAHNPDPSPISGKGRTGLILGLSIGSSVIIIAVLGATAYFLPRRGALFIPGPPQPHQFHENPIYVRNTVEQVNPLYKAL